ncbi:hypothetical protein AXF42_Ash014593 [Apostasia shenzhenica]|uniref:Uncharacterized protein n=1 Tax=Apostasia shenzhenica TaxID=1088818 RepID=A0A2I0AK50_9ASPA|nr:hypothetical protein AXF42_Ash014593 [Apostasia shenzhenica]
MAIYQIFVKLLDGRTKCFQMPSPIISGKTLKGHLFEKTKIPLPFQRLITGSRIVSDDTVIYASEDGLFPSCALLLRLPGGKGGFGSLLRGAATKAGQKKTNNFDACRDMSGRRLRHVNAEKKLEEWKSEAEDRRLEKLAEQFLKKKAKETKKNSSVDVDKYLEKYREDSAKCMEEVEESVRQSFEVYKDLKRKACPVSDRSFKRMKIWLGKNKVDDSCSEEDDDDEDDEAEEESVVLDDHIKTRGASSTMGSGSCAGSGASSDGESSAGGSDRSNLEQAIGNVLYDGLVSSCDQSNSDEADENCNVLPVVEPSHSIVVNDLDSNVSAEAKPMFAASAAHGDYSSGLFNLPEIELKPDVDTPRESSLDIEDKAGQASDDSLLEEQLNLDNYTSSSELEALGIERLKAELQARGLKCGGTLRERASRLFLLKTIPFDKLPKKLLAKPPSYGK